MLVTKEPIFRNFWYPVVPKMKLMSGPVSFTLLRERIVLWLDQEGNPAAAHDRCCHRSAQLSLGSVIEGKLICPYHGWQFNKIGQCIHIPQLPLKKEISDSYSLKVYHCTNKYGYVWVCLENPIMDIPEIPEAYDSRYRLIPEFYEMWNCSGLRVMENEFDLAHPTFVHAKTFGSEHHHTPHEIELSETPWGLHVHGVLSVNNPKLQKKNLKISDSYTQRTLEMDWYVPFTAKLKIVYPNGLEHIIVNTMTPIDDKKSQMVQFCLRNDTEEDTSATDIIAFDREVTLEDKRILESTDSDVPLKLEDEQHIFTDRPGIFMRKKLKAMTHSYNHS